eukprot:6361655-Pyramimonas_sp.AAC.1
MSSAHFSARALGGPRRSLGSVLAPRHSLERGARQRRRHRGSGADARTPRGPTRTAESVHVHA